MTAEEQAHLLQLLASDDEANHVLAETLLQHHARYPQQILLFYLSCETRCYETGLQFSRNYPESFFEAHSDAEEWAAMKQAYSIFCLLDRRFVNQGGCDYHMVSEEEIEQAWARFKPYLADYEVVLKHQFSSYIFDLAQMLWVEYAMPLAEEVLELLLRCIGRNETEYADALFWLAALHRNQKGDTATATRLFLDFLAIPNKDEPDNEFSLMNLNFRAMAYYPSTPLAYQQLGEMAWERGERDLAMDYLHKGIEANPTSYVAPRPLLARMCIERGDTEMAIALLEQQIDISRNRFHIKALPHKEYREWLVYVNLSKLYRQLADALEQSKHSAKALESYRFALFCDPFQYYEKAEDVLVEAANQCQASELKPWIEATLEYTKSYPLRRQLLIDLCLRLAQGHEAEQCREGYLRALHWYKNALKVSPAYLDALLGQMRIVAEQFKDYWQLESLAKTGLKHYPNNAALLNYLEIAKKK